MDARDHAAGLPDDAIGSDCSEAGAVLGGTALTAMERSYLSSMGPFEYDDPGPSGIYQKTEAAKGIMKITSFRIWAPSLKPGG